MTTRKFTALLGRYGLKQEFIPHCQQQNGRGGRVIRVLKGQCLYRQGFDRIQHTQCIVDDWISFYNNRHPHQALAIRAPAEACKSAA